MWDLVGKPEDRFSHNEAHISPILTASGNLQFAVFWASLIFQTRFLEAISSLTLAMYSLHIMQWVTYSNINSNRTYHQDNMSM